MRTPNSRKFAETVVDQIHFWEYTSLGGILPGGIWLWSRRCKSVLAGWSHWRCWRRRSARVLPAAVSCPLLLHRSPQTIVAARILKIHHQLQRVLRATAGRNLNRRPPASGCSRHPQTAATVRFRSLQSPHQFRLSSQQGKPTADKSSVLTARLRVSAAGCRCPASTRNHRQSRGSSPRPARRISFRLSFASGGIESAVHPARIIVAGTAQPQVALPHRTRLSSVGLSIREA